MSFYSIKPFTSINTNSGSTLVGAKQKKWLKISILILVPYAFYGCQAVSTDNVKTESSKNVPIENHDTNTSEANKNKRLTEEKKYEVLLHTVTGRYVSEGYEKRDAGYDWVAIDITHNKSNTTHNQIEINVFSRGDIKKTTCSYKGKATLMGQDMNHGIVYTANEYSKILEQDVTFLYRFKNGVLEIDSSEPHALMYYCSGGGSLIGAYNKLN